MNIPENDRNKIKQVVTEDRESAEYLANYGSPSIKQIAKVFILIADGKV